jgi:hypothetical protein
MWKYLVIFSFIIPTKGYAQIISQVFVDPCTQEVTTFTIPLQGGTTIIFLNKSKFFTAADISNGAFSDWLNTAYSDYRKTSPCSQQQGQVTQNQITATTISNTVQSVLNSTSTSESSESSEKKEGNNSPKSTQKISNSQGSSESSGSGGSNDKTGEETTGGSEVAAETTMSIDSKNEKSESSGGSNKNSRSNPIIISSDITTAQNLNRSFTPIVNITASSASLTGASSYGVTGMVWLNFKQFAISGRYSSIKYSKDKKMKLVHNLNLTGVYTYGNFLLFTGYSAILNAQKYGITGFNISGAATLISEDKSRYFSPTITGFYTKQIRINKKLMVSPEIYVISTPLIYSSEEMVTVRDRTFSGFIGGGIDYQISKRFKVNLNYKANVSSNPDFPILSFFLIGSKVNL